MQSGKPPSEPLQLRNVVRPQECAEDRPRVTMVLESPLRYTLKNEILIGCINLLSKLPYVRNVVVLNSF